MYLANSLVYFWSECPQANKYPRRSYAFNLENLIQRFYFARHIPAGDNHSDKIFFVLGLQPRLKNILGFGAISWYRAFEDPICVM